MCQEVTVEDNRPSANSDYRLASPRRPARARDTTHRLDPLTPPNSPAPIARTSAKLCSGVFRSATAGGTPWSLPCLEAPMTTYVLVAACEPGCHDQPSTVNKRWRTRSEER